MKKYFIKTDNFVCHHAIQHALYQIGYRWFLNENVIDIGNCGYILIIDSKYTTLSMENYYLQPNAIDDFIELKKFDDLPILNNP